MGTTAAFSHPPPVSAFNSPLSAALSSESGTVLLFPKPFDSLRSAMFRRKNVHQQRES